MNDRIRFVLGALLVTAGLGAYYYFADSALIIRVIALLAGLAAGGAIGWTTVPGQEFRTFAIESWDEAKRVTWPTGRETWQTTGVVFVLVVVVGLFLWLVDLGIVMFVARLMGRSE